MAEQEREEQLMLVLSSPGFCCGGHTASLGSRHPSPCLEVALNTRVLVWVFPENQDLIFRQNNPVFY